MELKIYMRDELYLEREVHDLLGADRLFAFARACAEECYFAPETLTAIVDDGDTTYHHTPVGWVDSENLVTS